MGSPQHLDTLSESVPDELDAYAAALLKRVCDAELLLATAESCTGGLLASVLTDVKGCGHAFERGFVVYTEEAKAELLGVDAALLRRCGAVSAPVAAAMAEGGLARSHADFCVSVTGYADDAGGEAEPGLVHFALARRGGETLSRRCEFGDRGRGGVRIACIATALRMIDEALAARA